MGGGIDGGIDVVGEGGGRGCGSCGGGRGGKGVGADSGGNGDDGGSDKGEDTRMRRGLGKRRARNKSLYSTGNYFYR